MRILLTFLLITGTLIPIEQPITSFTYESQISGVSIKFPGKPESRVRDYPEGKLEEVAFEDDNRTEYILEIRKATNREAMEEQIAKMGTRYQAARKMASAFHANNEGYTEGLKRKDWKVRKFKGDMVTFKGRGYDYHFRAIVFEDMSVRIIVKAKGAAFVDSKYDHKAAMKFADSFKIK